MGAKAPTPITVRLAPQCADLPQLVERPAFVGFHCTGGSSVEQDSPAEPKMVARAALLVENGPGPAKSRRRGKEPPPHHCNPVAGASDLVSRPTARLCRPQGWAARRAGQATPGVRHFGVRATYVPTLPISTTETESDGISHCAGLLTRGFLLLNPCHE